VALAACEQSGRDCVPEVTPLLDLPQCLALPVEPGELRLVLAPGTSLRLRELPPPTGPVTLLIGPEGGLDEGEMQAAATAGFTPVGLGPRVLRTETAGPAVLAALMALWGDG
jgi:16S rRNA (uracil1498-N3)-methyltransferase